jgi:hypothetical protein
MAEIHVSAWFKPCGIGGPPVPAELGAHVTKEALFNDRPDVKVPCLNLSFGNDTVRVWPADPWMIENLATKLQKCAALLRDMEEERVRKNREAASKASSLVPCKECDGKGRPPWPYSAVDSKCRYCHGTGKVEAGEP